ncbi:MAG: ISNCY family transposase, partial [Candidatus Rokuibacteriota bacterium]
GELVEVVREDLVRGLRTPTIGRRGMTAEQVLRAFVLQRVKAWDLRELRERTADGYTLRGFTRFFSAPVPRHDAFHRAFTRLTPATVRAINDAVVRAAVALELEDGTPLRVDPTVVQTAIHFPTDSTLLWDTVRVLTRLVRRLRPLLPSPPPPFPTRTRCARRRMQALQRLTATQRQTQQVPTYRALIRVTEQVVQAARAVVAVAPDGGGGEPLAAAHRAALAQEITHYCDLADRVVAQARRRVLQGETVPTAEKLFSIFEPHTDLIKRGKAQTPVEFGHKVFLAESAIGLITDYRVLDGNPPDTEHVGPVLDRHHQLFGTAPGLFAADRGFSSAETVAACADAGVATECLPQRGGTKTPTGSAHEKSRAFRRSQRFRAGIEGRISVLFRGRGMKRCPLHGPLRFEVFVGAAVLANNLLIIAAQLARTSSRRRRRAA